MTKTFLSAALVTLSLSACGGGQEAPSNSNDGGDSLSSSGTDAGVTGGAGVSSGGSGFSTGGASSGAGGYATGGTAAGGTNSGGTGSGGTGIGGANSGGANSGGANSGGANSGGANSGGASSGGAGTGGGSSIPPSATFTVSGRHLYDRCGKQVVLRGVNEMIIWSENADGIPEYSEIKKTGANVVRIVWAEEGTSAQLDAAITNALAQHLIPMVEHHGATGDLSLVPGVVSYWTRSDIAAVLKKHAAYLLLNIANEAGKTETQQAFRSTYESAITLLRGAGLTMPLIIDAPSWGQDIDMLQATGPALIAHDPLSKLLFSVHMWWHDPSGTRVIAELQESVNLGLPLIVGEFAQHAVSECNQQPFAYKTLLAEAQKHSIGWLAWSWGAVNNSDCAGSGSFDMTVGGVYGNWEETWGGEVAVSDPNSIKNTSVRPASIVNGACQ